MSSDPGFKTRVLTVVNRLEDAVIARDQEEAAEALEDLATLAFIAKGTWEVGGFEFLERQLGERVEEVEG